MKLGFIGCGNMAKAMIGGIIKSGLLDAGDIYASGNTKETLEKAEKEYGINIVFDNRDIAKTCDIVVLAVKPHIYETVINEIKDCVKDNIIVVTIAAGQSIKQVEDCFGGSIKIVRTMPNTPAMVGEGMTAMCPNALVSADDLMSVRKILEGFGKVEQVEERMIPAVIGVSGSSPAYVFMFIEAMADAAVAAGMPRAKAYTFAAQAVLGSAKMVLETGKHPGELKDMVCSPGGTTIEAVKELEAKGMRSAVMKAMEACIAKSISM